MGWPEFLPKASRKKGGIAEQAIDNKLSLSV
jgi:hypothetical protein